MSADNIEIDCTNPIPGDRLNAILNPKQTVREGLRKVWLGFQSITAASVLAIPRQLYEGRRCGVNRKAKD